MKNYKILYYIIFYIICVFLLFSCKITARIQEEAKRDKTVEKLLSVQPTIPINWSADRFLLNLRNIRFNDPNKINYLYLFLPNGDIYQYTIIGKLASTSKRLNSPIDRFGNPEPDIMGTYGNSTGSKVGMTTLGSLIEFGGFMAFIYSETPLIFKNRSKPIYKIKVEVSNKEKKEFLKMLKKYKTKRYIYTEEAL